MASRGHRSVTSRSEYHDAYKRSHKKTLVHQSWYVRFCADARNAPRRLRCRARVRARARARACNRDGDHPSSRQRTGGREVGRLQPGTGAVLSSGWNGGNATLFNSLAHARFGRQPVEPCRCLVRAIQRTILPDDSSLLPKNEFWRLHRSRLRFSILVPRRQRF